MKINANPNWPYPGARWWKFDFHTHTPASHDYGKGSAQARHRAIEPKQWLLGFMQAGVDCVAVTDHNSGEWIDLLKEALRQLGQEQPAGYRPLWLFPGVEITANGSVHVLALLDLEKEAADIHALLGAVEYQGKRGGSDAAANKSVIDVVKAVTEAGGIPILAHVDKRSGAWQRLSGNTLKPLLEADGLFAIEVVDPHHERPGPVIQRNPDWAEVLGSDSHHPDGKEGQRFPGSHFTWVKMAEPSLEGLRLALLDGSGLSIRRSDPPSDAPLFDPFAVPQHFLESIEIQDARFMGRGQPARLSFNPWLNALVGGRGTGKSTVVHTLRFAARRQDELEQLAKESEPWRAFERFNKVPADRSQEGGLRKDTEIRLRLVREGVRHLVRWRQDGNEVVVEEETSDGSWKQSPVQSVTRERFPIRLFSQGHIAALSGGSQPALLQVIDDAADVSVLQRKLDEARETFLSTRARIRQLTAKLGHRSDLILKRQDLERKLKQFEEAGHAEVLTEYRSRRRQVREMDRQFEVALAAADAIDETAEKLQPEDAESGLFNKSMEGDRAATDAVGALADAIRTAARRLKDAAQELRDVARERQAGLDVSSWKAAVDQATNKYNDLVSALRQEGVEDLNQYGRLTQDRQEVDLELAALDSLEKERDELADQSHDQLREVLANRQAVTAARNEFLITALAQNNFVRISVRAYGDDLRVDGLRVIERSLRKALGTPTRFEHDILDTADAAAPTGCIADLIAELPDDDAKRSLQFEQRIEALKQKIHSAARGGKSSFGGMFTNHLKKKFDETPEAFDRIQAWFPEDALRVEYSRGSGRDFQPITQASAGQRAAAMLAFLLAHGDEPLVLDQPEDDLDNHLIYDLVVRQIRESKGRRQIIVVTHNPNIVVNGDAEMLHAMDFRKGQCMVATAGSLQEKAMREEVCRIMEGGRDAFEQRYRRLASRHTDV